MRLALRPILTDGAELVKAVRHDLRKAAHQSEGSLSNQPLSGLSIWCHHALVFVNLIILLLVRCIILPALQWF